MDWITAIGDIFVAAAVVAASWQAWETRKQGEAAKGQFLQARYDNARPVLRIVSGPQVIPIQQGNEMYLDWGASLPSIEVRNIGNGPAFNVRSVIYESEAIAVPTHLSPLSSSWKHMSDTKDIHWYHWTTDAVSQEASIKLQYEFPNKHFRNNIFSEANKFIESQDHKQKYSFNAPKQPLSQSTPKDPTHICRVIITYHDIFRRKHASIYDLVFRQRWQVIVFIDDIIKDLDDLVE